MSSNPKDKVNIPSEQATTAEFNRAHPSDPTETAQAIKSNESHSKGKRKQPLSQDNQLPSIASSSQSGQLSSREILHQSAQQIVEDINHKRKQDSEFMLDFKKGLEMNVQKILGVMEQNIYQLYNQQSQKIQSTLQELFDTLERVAAIETELVQFRHVLGSLYQDVQTHE